MARREFSEKTKQLAFARSGGRCEHVDLRTGKRCENKVERGGGGKRATCRFNHRTMDFFGGANDLENCQVLCLPCDHVQTYTRDIPAAAKSKRILGETGKRKWRKPLPGGRGSKLKRKLPTKKHPFGQTVRR